MALRSYIAEEIAHDWADGLLTRREALRRLALMGLSVSGAAALLAACGSDSDDADRVAAPTAAGPATTAAAGAGAATTAPAPATANAAAKAETISFAGPNGELQGAWATAPTPRGGVLVIHENRGLTPHFYDLVGRLAGDGYAALTVDLLSEEGGTAKLTDPAGAPAALAGAPGERLIGDLRAGIDELERRAPGKPVGVVGFCFGGGMTWNLLNAGEARLKAAAPFYGPAPENPNFANAKAAVLAVYGELDSRVNSSRDRAEAALKAAGLPHQVRTFAGADHAFFNDTGPRYNEQAAKDAYAALLEWFKQYLV